MPPVDNALLETGTQQTAAGDTSAFAATAGDANAEVLLARQAIFDTRQNVFGYELLYRSAGSDSFDGSDAGLATSTVLANALCVLGLDRITGGKTAFINFPEGMLLDDSVSVLPPDRVVIELLETVRPTEAVVEECRGLKKRGYQLALDDFIYAPELEALLGLADILKVDFLLSGEEERRKLAERYRGRIRLLAEKVEEYDVFRDAKAWGYELFQGYFFARPTLMRRRDIPASRLRLFELLRELQRPELEFSRVEALIRAEAGLVYKLLRFVNSAAFHLRAPIENIRHALVLLGERQLRHWATLVTMAGMGSDKCPELVTSLVVRARLLEALAPLLGYKDRAAEFFLLGMLSRLDALLDCTTEDLLAHIPVTDTMRHTLLSPGCGTEFCVALSLADACERGDWEKLGKVAKRFSLSPVAVNRLYLEALHVADCLPA